MLVTKDEDFHRMSIVHGAPPKVVWIRLGNCTTGDIADLIRKHHRSVDRFAQQDRATFLVLGGPPARLAECEPCPSARHASKEAGPRLTANRVGRHP